MNGPSLRDATTPRRLDEDLFAVEIDETWNVIIGPNGGLVSAALVRAAQERVDMPVRSFTAHFMRPPIGPTTAEITTRVVRAGRTVTTLAIDLAVAGRTCVTALVALGATRESPVVDFASRELPPLPTKWPAAVSDSNQVSFRRYWSAHPVIGIEPPDLAATPIVSGWMRPASGELIDAASAAAALDGWWPALFTTIGPAGQLPTIDLTVHFATAELEVPAVYLEAHTTLLREGYFDEDAAVWSADGKLLARSRQLGAFYGPQPRPGA